jgi:hypothetical protein
MGAGPAVRPPSERHMQDPDRNEVMENLVDTIVVGRFFALFRPPRHSPTRPTRKCNALGPAL